MNIVSVNIVSVAPVIDIAKHAGDQIIMPFWGKVAVEKKEDSWGNISPVTIADKKASDYIIKQLQQLTPNIPVISEEASFEDNLRAMQSRLRWVVDPLDGTATFSEGFRFKDPGFGVHIALVADGKPILGVAYFPAKKLLYFTGNDGHAYCQHANENPGIISARTEPQDEIIHCAVPWKTFKQPESVNGHPYTPVVAVGAEQLCLVADGTADLMWHDRPDKDQPLKDRLVFSHWDLAAAHAITKAAGGDLFEITNGQSISYNDSNLAIPACVAGHPDMLRLIGFNPNVIHSKYYPAPRIL